VSSGTLFKTREELVKIHSNLMGDCSCPVDGGPASSVLVLDTLAHDDRGNCALYVGDKVMTNHPSETPILSGPNYALVQNVKQKIPVRVIRGHEDTMIQNFQLSRHVPQTGYRYDGLYFVGDYWFEQIDTNLWQYVFKLVRIYGQSALPSQTELYRSFFPPTINLLQEEIQKFGLDPNQQTFFPAPPPTPSPSPPHTNAANAIHALLQRHKQMQQQQQQQQQRSIPQQIQQHVQMSRQNLPPNFVMYNQPQQPPPSPPRRQVVSAPTKPILGMDLGHGPVREMLNQLRRKNSTQPSRLEQYQHDIDKLTQKSSQGHVEEKKVKLPNTEQKDAVTSRNKGFFWNLEKKRKKDNDESGEKGKKRMRDASPH
jgi:hypothetical protein